MSLEYQKMRGKLIDYFKSGESHPDDFKLGLELEHFILNRDTLRAIPYQGENGIANILMEMTAFDWYPIKENGYIIGLRNDNANISLEPGAQFELSIKPYSSIKKIKNIYDSFLEQIIPILEKRNQSLFTLGYQPVSNINDIELLPKKRYLHMYDYFKDKGKLAHNMMKCTSSLQVNLDYSSEIDFRKKIRAVYFLSPLIYYIFDNSPFFEGVIYPEVNIRSNIWDNCDKDRSGFIENVFNKDFSYGDYADYILNTPGIISIKNGKMKYIGQKFIREIYDSNSFNIEEIEHSLSMVFPDVRLKKYLEIRMGDSLPYPFNMAYAAFWQGLLYNKNNLDYLYRLAEQYNNNDTVMIKKDIEDKGDISDAYGKPLSDFMIELIDMASSKTDKEGMKYLSLLKEFLINNINFKNKTIKKYMSDRNIRKALDWCMILRGASNDKKIAERI